jgi:GTP-binding protein EngB required for normal cell division
MAAAMSQESSVTQHIAGRRKVGRFSNQPGKPRRANSILFTDHICFVRCGETTGFFNV